MTAVAFALDWNQISAYAAKMGPKKDYPTVIIGAGLGGLVCGAYLARQGIPVTLVEQHSVPGGYAIAIPRGYAVAICIPIDVAICRVRGVDIRGLTISFGHAIASGRRRYPDQYDEHNKFHVIVS